MDKHVHAAAQSGAGAGIAHIPDRDIDPTGLQGCEVERPHLVTVTEKPACQMKSEEAAPAADRPPGQGVSLPELLLLTNYFLRASVPLVTKTSDRMTAAERREMILAAAVEEIAVSGFSGATTADIAKRAGISQPYVFRFFPTKKDLAMAVIDRCVSRIIADWESAVPQPGETRLMTLGRTYRDSLSDRRSELMVHLNAYASAEDPDIAAAMRHHLSRIYRYVIHLLERDGNPNAYEEAGGFLSRGFLINAAMAIGLESALTPEEWAGICGKKAIARIEDRLEHDAA